MTAIIRSRFNKICQPRVPYKISIAHNSKNWRHIIGDREIVGPGKDNVPNYYDLPAYPCPAIRFQPNSPYIQALREKEKCDWRNLTIEEKKCLYRASFCQTYAEFTAPTGQWKSNVGFALLFLGIGMWVFMFVKLFIMNPMPSSCSPAGYRRSMKRNILLEIGLLEGISSYWDYEKWTWKNGIKDSFYNGEGGEFAED